MASQKILYLGWTHTLIYIVQSRIRIKKSNLGGLSEITRIKSYELIILNYLLEGNIWLRNMILQNQLNIWFGFVKFIVLNQIFPSKR